MGMTPKQIITQLTNMEKLYQPVTPLVINEAKELAKKYQQLHADYENRLKADMVAMLEEISLEIDEMDCTIDHDFEGYYTGHVDCQKLIREKINALKGEGEK